MKRSLALIAAVCLHLNTLAAPPAGPEQEVGRTDDGATIVPNGQRVRPAGRTLEFPGMPVDLALAPDGKRLFVKNVKSLAVVDLASWALSQELLYDDQGKFGSMHGMAVWDDARGRTHVLVTGAKQSMFEAVAGPAGSLAWDRTIHLPGPRGTDAHATGVAVTADRTRAYVCLSRNNSLGVVDLIAGKLLHESAVGICPYDVVLANGEKEALVSNFGGRRAKAGDKTEQSTGTPVPVDGRSINISGTVSLVDLEHQNEVA